MTIEREQPRQRRATVENTYNTAVQFRHRHGWSTMDKKVTATVSHAEEGHHSTPKRDCQKCESAVERRQ